MQVSLARFVTPNTAAFAVCQGMVQQYEDHVYAETLAQEIVRAQAYLTNYGQQWADCMVPMAMSVGRVKCTDLYAQFQRTDPPASMSFSATLWMLDLQHRLIGIDRLDLARMRWAIEAVQMTGTLKVMDGFPVAAESVQNADGYKELRKVERDADLDAILLAVYWNEGQDDTQKHPWHDHLRDLHFKAQRVGQGVEATVERFVRFEEEEKKRQVMGLSTFRRATELKDVVDKGQALRQANECDADLAAKILGQKETLKAAWTPDTCRRYLTISERFNTEATQIMMKWEMKFGRTCLLDQLHTMRSATTASQTPEQMTVLVRTVFWEQTCRLRTSLGQRTKSSAGDATALCRAILLRHLFYQYILQVFPKLHDTASMYGTWRWYHTMYGMQENGRIGRQDESSEEADAEDKEGEDEGGQTRFESKRKLKNLLDATARGKHEKAFISMARATSSSMNLDLGCEGMVAVQRQVNEIWALYKAEFPDQPQTQPALPSTEVDVTASAGVYTPAHVKATSSIETQEEYHAKLSKYQEECRTAAEGALSEHINMRVAIIIADLDGPVVVRKLERVSFMKELGRKLFVYDSLVQDPLNWTKLRKMKRSFMTRAKVNMVCQQAGTMGQDTLQVLKDVYLHYKTERQPDGLCEDVVMAVVPGTSADTPRNEYLDAAWRSLKALGNKHVGPKIGEIKQDKTALLQQVYSRGVWGRSPDHNLVFTYQAVPRNTTGRKRMKYLSEGGSFGDTAFNSWPVPLVPIADMPKVTEAIHEDIFAQDDANDSGAEDGTGAAVVQDLGDKIIPFPREISEMLTREAIHVWDIDVCIFLNPGSGKSLLAVVKENRRAVAIVKNKAQKTFIMKNLAEAVQAANLVTDRRPPKPQELTAWEAAKGLAVTGGAAAAKASSQPPPTGVALAAAPAAGGAAAGAGGGPSLPSLVAAKAPALPSPIVGSGAAASNSSAPPVPTAAMTAFGQAVLR